MLNVNVPSPPVVTVCGARIPFASVRVTVAPPMNVAWLSHSKTSPTIWFPCADAFHGSTASPLTRSRTSMRSAPNPR